jgi:hypothetical protein
MNVNQITSTKSTTITGQYIRKNYDELIKLQQETKQKYISFYNNLQDNPALCKKFLFLNSVFNIALRESSKFKQTEHLYNLLAEFVAECSQLAPEALKVFDNELWSHCILINTHTHDNQFIKAVKNTLSLPIRSLIERMSGYQRNNYSSLTQYLCGADPDLSLTEPYEAFLRAAKINTARVYEELKHVGSLLVSSLPSDNMYYILRFYLAVAFNPSINIKPFQVTQYAHVCGSLIINFSLSKIFIDEEIILAILDIHKTHKVRKFGESSYIEGLPSNGQWEFVNYSVYHNIIQLVKENKFYNYKDQIFFKFVDSCMRGGIAFDIGWLGSAAELIRDGHISDIESQCYFLEALKHFYNEDVVNSYFIRDLIASIGKSIVDNKVIILLYKILVDYNNKNLLTMFRIQVGPLLNIAIKPYLAGKRSLLIERMRLKDLFAEPGRELWRLINKQFLDKKMIVEHLSIEVVAEILRNLHVSTDLSIIRQVIKQLELYDDPAPSALPESNKLMWKFLHSHAFYFEPDKIVALSEVEPFPVFAFRQRMKGIYNAVSFIESSYIFDGRSRVIFVSDGRQFKDLNSVRPDNLGFDFRGLTMIDLADPEGKYPPLPINSQTIKTFPQWLINLYSHQLSPNKEVIPHWMLKVAFPYIFAKYKEVIATIKPQKKSNELISDINRYLENIYDEGDSFIDGVGSILHDTTPSFYASLKDNIRALDDTLEVLRFTYKKDIHQIVYKDFVNKFFVNKAYKEENQQTEQNFGIKLHKMNQLYLVGLISGVLSGVKGLGEERNSIHFLRFFAGFIMQDLSNLLRIALADVTEKNVAQQLLNTDSCSNSIISPLVSHPFTKKVINEYAHESFISTPEHID